MESMESMDRWNALQWSAMEWSRWNALQWSGMEWMHLSILDPFVTFCHFGSILGNLLDKKTPFQNVVPSGRIFKVFFWTKNAVSKCRTFGSDLLGRPARLVQHFNFSVFFVFYPAPFLIIYFAPPHFCPPKMARRRRKFGRTYFGHCCREAVVTWGPLGLGPFGLWGPLGPWASFP